MLQRKQHLTAMVRKTVAPHPAYLPNLSSPPHAGKIHTPFTTSINTLQQQQTNKAGLIYGAQDITL